jgi:GTP-binding protein
MMQRGTFPAQFMASAFALAECPRWDRIEVALAGRSNVGKSSLLNAVAGVKGLARAGKTPGKTRSLNFFTVGDTLALCDLPGYGYARTSHEEAHRIATMMREYIKQREQLAAVAILIDLRRGPEREELDLATSVIQRGLQVLVIATKSDKIGRSRRAEAIARFAPIGVAPIVCSAVSGEGIDEIRRRLFALARPLAADAGR